MASTTDAQTTTKPPMTPPIIGPVLLGLLVSLLMPAVLELAPGTAIVAADAAVVLVLVNYNETDELPDESDADEDDGNVVAAEDDPGAGVCDGRNGAVKLVLETAAAVGETR